MWFCIVYQLEIPTTSTPTLKLPCLCVDHIQSGGKFRVIDGIQSTAAIVSCDLNTNLQTNLEVGFETPPLFSLCVLLGRSQYLTDVGIDHFICGHEPYLHGACLRTPGGMACFIL